ncbi:MAG: hypothetical protein WA631_00555 [Nitrososphaeraceae archaeon]
MYLSVCKSMGGAKKRPVSATERESASTQGDTSAGAYKSAKKTESKKGGGQQQQKQKLSVLVEEAGGRKALDNMKAITAQAFARVVGVKISVANAYIRSLESKNVLSCIGGYSGHRVYQLKR